MKRRQLQPQVVFRSSLFASIGLAVLVAAMMGCTERRIADSTAPAMTEKSVADQADAVRRGEAVQIRLDYTKVVDADLLQLND